MSTLFQNWDFGNISIVLALEQKSVFELSGRMHSSCFGSPVGGCVTLSIDAMRAILKNKVFLDVHLFYEGDASIWTLLHDAFRCFISKTCALHNCVSE